MFEATSQCCQSNVSREFCNLALHTLNRTLREQLLRGAYTEGETQKQVVMTDACGRGSIVIASCVYAVRVRYCMRLRPTADLLLFLRRHIFLPLLMIFSLIFDEHADTSTASFCHTTFLSYLTLVSVENMICNFFSPQDEPTIFTFISSY